MLQTDTREMDIPIGQALFELLIASRLSEVREDRKCGSGWVGEHPGGCYRKSQRARLTPTRRAAIAKRLREGRKLNREIQSDRPLRKGGTPQEIAAARARLTARLSSEKGRKALPKTAKPKYFAMTGAQLNEQLQVRGLTNYGGASGKRKPMTNYEKAATLEAWDKKAAAKPRSLTRGVESGNPVPPQTNAASSKARSLRGKTKVELRNQAAAAGLPIAGSKEDLVTRLASVKQKRTGEGTNSWQNLPPSISPKPTLFRAANGRTVSIDQRSDAMFRLLNVRLDARECQGGWSGTLGSCIRGKKGSLRAQKSRGTIKAGRQSLNNLSKGGAMTPEREERQARIAELRAKRLRPALKNRYRAMEGVSSSQLAEQLKQKGQNPTPGGTNERTRRAARVQALMGQGSVASNKRERLLAASPKQIQAERTARGLSNPPGKMSPQKRRALQVELIAASDRNAGASTARAMAVSKKTPAPNSPEVEINKSAVSLASAIASTDKNMAKTKAKSQRGLAAAERALVGTPKNRAKAAERRARAFVEKTKAALEVGADDLKTTRKAAVSTAKKARKPAVSTAKKAAKRGKTRGFS